MTRKMVQGTRRFPKETRLRKRQEFLALQRGGRRRHTPHFTVITKGCGAERLRLGVTAASHLGKAVLRNRVRRLVREFFRLHRWRIHPAQDILVVAKTGAEELNYARVAEELGKMFGLTKAAMPYRGEKA